MDGLQESPDDAHIYDVVIPYHEKDSEILPYCIDGIQRHLRGVRNIYVISRECPDIEDPIQWISESQFPFTLEDVGTYIQSTNGRQGWYYQQLLKFYAHTVIPGLLNKHLIVDSDVVFVRPVEFFKGGKLLFDYGGMYVPAYFDHMQALSPTDFNSGSKESGVTDCMMFRADILQELFKRIETNHNRLMWQALLSYVVPERYNHSGMSEQEMYFHFVLANYPEIHETRLLDKSHGVHLNELQRTDVDFLSFHAWFRDWQRGFTKASE